MSTADAIAALARLLAAGSPLRDALVRWAKEVPGRGDIKRVGDALRLGASIPDASRHLENSFGDDGYLLCRVVALHARLGGDLVTMLERLAEMSAAGEIARRDAEMHVAGIRLSARMVAALPLFFVPLLPASRAPIADGTGSVLLLLGGVLSLAGMRWIDRLLPRPPRDGDPYQAFLIMLAAVVAGGCSHHQALMACTADARGSSGPALAAARRRVLLGVTWAHALTRADDEPVRRLGHLIGTATELGLPMSEVLAGAARAHAAETKMMFDVAVRKAPVKMIVPLTTCVLPAFAVIGAGPFLRGVVF